jgi:hypothetical protein
LLGDSSNERLAIAVVGGFPYPVIKSTFLSTCSHDTKTVLLESERCSFHRWTIVARSRVFMIGNSSHQSQRPPFDLDKQECAKFVHQDNCREISSQHYDYSAKQSAIVE